MIMIVIFVGLFYYTLGNLPPRLRSTLNSIQLVTICNSKDVDTYGIDKILEPFIEAIQALEKVISVKYPL
jgi:type IV secretory pathway TrbL component